MTCPSIPVLGYGDFSQRLIGKATGQRIPISGSLEITFRCNMRCVHCYLSDRRYAPKDDELTTAEIKHIIDQIVAEGCLWFLITGGEPFIRPDLIEILRYAKKKGLLVTLFTNGTLLTPEIVRQLAEFPPLVIEITLYGFTQETYEKVTGIPGSHARCMRGIELLKSNNLPFKLKTVLMTLNCHEFQAMQAFASELGVSFRYDQNLNPTLDREKSPCDYRVEPNDLIPFEQDRMSKSGSHLDLQALINYVPADSEQLYQCGAGLRSFHIDPYGKLSPCIMARWQSYNLRSGSFKGGWSDFLKNVREQKVSQQTQCQVCKLRPFCNQCPASGMLEHGDPLEPSEYLCQVANMRATAFFPERGV